MLAMKLVLNQQAPPTSADGGASCCDELAPLVDRANQGDRAALGSVLGAVAPAMLRMVRAVLGPSHPDVPDITQEALMALPGALTTFRKESSVKQYARQVALRIALSARRRRQVRERLFQGWQNQQESKPEMTGPQAYHTLLVERRAALLRELLDELPEEQAHSFAMRVLLDYTLPQVAAATDATLNTVRSRVRLAKEKLRERLEADPALIDLLREGDS
jgi:RNA polymerase sigma-70 factor (ECF subfamily)